MDLEYKLKYYEQHGLVDCWEAAWAGRETLHEKSVYRATKPMVGAKGDTLSGAYANVTKSIYLSDLAYVSPNTLSKTFIHEGAHRSGRGEPEAYAMEPKCET